MSVAVFTSRAEKWVGEGREEDSSDVRFEIYVETLCVGGGGGGVSVKYLLTLFIAFFFFAQRT